ncbi:MAG: hypothetical protein ABH919_03940 [bacterium]
MNFLKTKNKFLSSSCNSLMPDKDYFNDLIIADSLPKAWYFTLNINFREEKHSFEILKLKTKLAKFNNSDLRIQPQSDLHCSLLNILTIPYDPEVNQIEIINRILQNNKNELEDFVQKFFSEKQKFYADFLYVSKESVALQVFIDNKIVRDLKQLKKELEESKCAENVRNEFPEVIWENKLKLNPKEQEGKSENYDDAWGAMNLIRYNVEKLTDLLAKDLSEEIKSFNRKSIEERNKTFFIKFNLKPVLVISDHLFDEKSGSRIL